MNMHQRIIEQLDGELFASDLSYETLEDILIEAGWYFRGGHAGYAWWDHDRIKTAHIRIDNKVEFDKDTQETTKVPTFAEGFDGKYDFELKWAIDNLGTPEGFQKLEQYANTVENWTEA